MSYQKMLASLAVIIHRRTFLVPMPLSLIKFYAYLVSLFTPVPNAIVRCLIEGLKNEVVCQDDAIKEYLPFEPISFQQAVLRAMTREDQDRVSTRWSDAYPPAQELALKLEDLDHDVAYLTRHSRATQKPAEELFRSICKIGGKEGWYTSSWLWKLRGWLDRLFLGVGSSRGRKSRVHLEIHDVIDFWRIEDLVENQRLLLRAEMKMPGRAWLELTVEQISGSEQRLLSVAAYFDTESFLGRIYWYCLVPVHFFIFKNMIKQIEKRS
ncbi:MAG: SDR family oxidoreductase [candidate division Zixibacteria bacterium]|nr:SDR family oxidoreductase [candidate division Zixibacteria bacterium]